LENIGAAETVTSKAHDTNSSIDTITVTVKAVARNTATADVVGDTACALVNQTAVAGCPVSRDSKLGITDCADIVVAACFTVIYIATDTVLK
jgi:hypothetical protein